MSERQAARASHGPRAMSSRSFFARMLLLSLASCSCGGAPAPEPSAAPLVPLTPSYEVHEWGLVRGTVSDHVMITGPYAPQPIVPVAKPVLYFHRDAPRDGETALVVDVDAEIVEGHIVERWPGPASSAPSISWHGVVVQDGSCHGSRYPTLSDEPCTLVRDGCEASTLASVETTDSDCLSWPPPPGGEGPTESWNHLFYRGERTTAPDVPLRLAPQPDGTLRVTATGSEPIPGRFIRIRRGNGVVGVTDAAEIVDPPAPGSSVSVPAPTDTLASAALALDASLHAAGLTDEEVAAFRRSWDEALFGPVAVATRASSSDPAVATATPIAVVVPPTVTRSVLYVLPLASADGIARLTFTPAPRVIRRAIVVWLDEASAP